MNVASFHTILFDRVHTVKMQPCYCMAVFIVFLYNVFLQQG